MATERDVYNALTGAGFDMSQAAGIMGNIQNESGYNQEAIGDNGNSFGLVQWNVGTYPNAPGYVTGNLARDFTNQIHGIVGASHGVNMGGTASDVAGAWASEFERCVGCQPGGPQYIARQQNADRIFQQAKSGHWPPGPNPGGPGGPQPPGTVAAVSAPGIIQELGSFWGFPFSFWESTGATVSGIVTATEDAAQAIASVANAFNNLFQFFTWWFVPSHIVRVVAGILGVPLVGFGIFNLTRTGQPYNVQAPVVGQIPMSGGNLAPAIGILEVTIGAALLFIAFHNLPQNVTDLPSLISYMQQGLNPAAGEGGGGHI